MIKSVWLRNLVLLTVILTLTLNFDLSRRNHITCIPRAFPIPRLWDHSFWVMFRTKKQTDKQTYRLANGLERWPTESAWVTNDSIGTNDTSTLGLCVYFCMCILSHICFSFNYLPTGAIKYSFVKILSHVVWQILLAGQRRQRPHNLSNKIKSNTIMSRVCHCRFRSLLKSHIAYSV